MADRVQFKYPATTGNNDPVKSFEQAQRTIATCFPCGCDDILGYTTMLDVETGEVGIVYLDNGVLTAVDYTANGGTTFAEWVQWFKDVCTWRAGGSVGQRPAEPNNT